MSAAVPVGRHAVTPALGSRSAVTEPVRLPSTVTVPIVPAPWARTVPLRLCSTVKEPIEPAWICPVEASRLPSTTIEAMTPEPATVESSMALMVPPTSPSMRIAGGVWPEPGDGTTPP